MVHTLPNYLTLLRLALIPAFVILMIDPTPGMVMLAVGVFIFAALTDYVDGYIARRFRSVSEFGKLLDPLADKMLVAAALIMLVSQRSDPYGEPWVPGWLVVLVMLREIWVTGIRGIAATSGVVVAARGGGKVKSGLQMVAIVLLLLHDRSVIMFGHVVPLHVFGLFLLSLSLFFSYWAATEYTLEVLKLPTVLPGGTASPTSKGAEQDTAVPADKAL